MSFASGLLSAAWKEVKKTLGFLIPFVDASVVRLGGVKEGRGLLDQWLSMETYLP